MPSQGRHYVDDVSYGGTQHLRRCSVDILISRTSPHPVMGAQFFPAGRHPASELKLCHTWLQGPPGDGVLSLAFHCKEPSNGCCLIATSSPGSPMPEAQGREGRFEDLKCLTSQTLPVIQLKASAPSGPEQSVCLERDGHPRSCSLQRQSLQRESIALQAHPDNEGEELV